MNCPSCRHPNPADAHFCANCGVQVVAHTGANAAIADLVNDSATGATAAASPSTPTTPTAPPHSEPLPDQTTLTTTAPFGVDPHTPGADRVADPPALLVAGKKSSMLPIVLSVAVVAVIVGMGAFLVLSSGDDDAVASVTTDDITATTDAVSATPPATDAAVATVPPAASAPVTDAPAVTAAPETAPPATDASVTTVPPTIGPPTTAPPSTDPAAIPPVPPEPGPINAPGSPQVLANVSPSGVPFTESATAFAIAQELGDALALQDWASARSLSPELAGNSDDDFAVGYANTNRVSLILVDARRSGSQIELLVVSVAVELGGDQTSLYCLQWNVDPDARTVDQDGGSRIARWQANAQPEAIRNDADALATVNQCRWP